MLLVDALPFLHNSVGHVAITFFLTWRFRYTFLWRDSFCKDRPGFCIPDNRPGLWWNNAAHGTPGRSHHQSIRHTHTPARDGRSLCFWDGYNKWKERVFSAFFTSIFYHPTPLYRIFALITRKRPPFGDLFRQAEDPPFTGGSCLYRFSVFILMQFYNGGFFLFQKYRLGHP